MEARLQVEALAHPTEAAEGFRAVEAGVGLAHVFEAELLAEHRQRLAGGGERGGRGAEVGDLAFVEGAARRGRIGGESGEEGAHRGLLARTRQRALSSASGSPAVLPRSSTSVKPAARKSSASVWGEVEADGALVLDAAAVGQEVGPVFAERAGAEIDAALAHQDDLALRGGAPRDLVPAEAPEHARQVERVEHEQPPGDQRLEGARQHLAVPPVVEGVAEARPPVEGPVARHPRADHERVPGEEATGQVAGLGLPAGAGDVALALLDADHPDAAGAARDRQAADAAALIEDGGARAEREPLHQEVERALDLGLARAIEQHLGEEIVVEGGPPSVARVVHALHRHPRPSAASMATHAAAKRSSQAPAILAQRRPRASSARAHLSWKRCRSSGR